MSFPFSFFLRGEPVRALRAHTPQSGSPGILGWSLQGKKTKAYLFLVIFPLFWGAMSTASITLSPNSRHYSLYGICFLCVSRLSRGLSPAFHLDDEMGLWLSI